MKNAAAGKWRDQIMDPISDQEKNKGRSIMTTATKKRSGNRKKAEKRTVAHLLLDMTGSMLSSRQTTLLAVNEYLRSIRDGKDTQGFVFTLSLFNSSIGVRPFQDASPAAKIKTLGPNDYEPNAITPLYDAIGQTITDAAAQTKKGDGTLIVIVTDGWENASREYTKDGIIRLIDEKQKEGWQFVYLAQNLDAMAAGAQLGVDPGNTVSYSLDTSSQAYQVLASSTAQYAAGGSTRGASFTGSRHTRDLRR